MTVPVSRSLAEFVRPPVDPDPVVGPEGRGAAVGEPGPTEGQGEVGPSVAAEVMDLRIPAEVLTDAVTALCSLIVPPGHREAWIRSQVERRRAQKVASSVGLDEALDRLAVPGVAPPVVAGVALAAAAGVLIWDALLVRFGVAAESPVPPPVDGA